MSTPAISVVMPVYNGEKYLREAIDSILNQTFSDFEFIILNDGSTDKTEDIILSYSDPRIVYVKNSENIQIVNTLNKGVSLAKGKYIARMDADDISHPDRFEIQYNFMENNLGVALCGTLFEQFNEDFSLKIKNIPLSYEEIKVAMMFGCPVAHPTVMIRKSIFSHYKYDQNYNKAEDYFLWYEISKKNIITNLPYNLLYYRIHNKQSSNEFSDLQAELSDRIKVLSVMDFGIEPMEDEKLTHVLISRSKPVDCIKAVSWLDRINKRNIECGYFDNQILKKYIDDKYWSLLNANSQFGFKTLIYLVRNNKLTFSYDNILPFIKILIKCLIRYKA